MRLHPLLVACIVAVSTGWFVTNTGAAAETLADAYGVDLSRIGLLTTALFGVHMLMQLPAGRLSDRFGPAAVTAAGMAILGVANAVALVAPDEYLALVLRGVMGLGLALAFLGGSDYVRATGGSPLAQSLYGGVATAGAGVALPVVPLLVPLLGWRSPYLSGVVVVVFGLLALAFGPRPEASQAGRRAAIALRTLAADRSLGGLAILFAGSFGLSMVVGNWAPFLLEHSLALEPVAAGALVGVSMALTIVSRPFGGWVLEQHPDRIPVLIGASAVAGAAGTLLLASGSLAGAIVGTCFVGLAAGTPFALAFTGAARMHPNAPAAAVGLVNGAAAFTVLVGVWLVGIAFEHDAGSRAFVVIAILWLASAVALPAVGRRATHP